MCQYTADGTQLKGCEGIFGVLGKEKAEEEIRKKSKFRDKVIMRDLEKGMRWVK